MAGRKRQEKCVWMARKLGKLASRRGQTAKIGLSDGCWKIWLPLGCHDGTISVDLEAIWGMSDCLIVFIRMAKQ